MAVFANLPDWGAPLDGADGLAWLACGQPHRALGLATGLVLERDDGRPGYALESFRLSSDPRLDSFGVLTMRFVGDFRLAERRKALFASLPDVHLDVIPLQDGFVRFLSARAMDMQGLDAAQPLMSAGSGVKLTLKLAGQGIAAFNSLVSGGDVPILAQIIYQADGRAIRARGTANVDGRALLPLLQELPGGFWSRSALVDALKANHFGPALTVETEETEPMATARAIDAAIDRLTALAFVLKAADRPEAEPMWEVQAEALADRTLVLRLDDDFAAPRGFLLRSSALTPPEMVEREIEDDHGTITMATGMHVVTIDANLPPVRVGIARAGVELTVPANPPHRTETIRKTLIFDGAAGLAVVPLRLSPDEPLAFDYQTFVIALSGGSAERLEGPKLRNEDTQLTVPPSAFPVDFQRAEATASILQFGSVAVRWSAALGTGSWHAEASLTPAAPAVAVAIPPGCDALIVNAELVAADGSGRLAIPADAGATLWFDLSGVPQAGPQSARFEADFGGKRSTVMIECVANSEADSAAPPTLILLRETSPEAEYRWLPDNPFRAGFRCRWSATSGQVSDWSPPYPGGSTVSVMAGSEQSDPWPGFSNTRDTAPAKPDISEDGEKIVDTSGLELFAAGAGSYFFRSNGPRLQRTPEGKPAIQLMGTDQSAFLQITAEWTVGADRLSALAAAISKRDGASPTLAPAPDNVRETALEIAQADGSYAVAATGTALGVAPQTSLLTATLVAEQAEAVRRAIAGERGLARLRYTIDAADPVSTEHSFAATASDGGTHAAFSRHDSAGSFNRHVIESVSDLADAMKS